MKKLLVLLILFVSSVSAQPRLCVSPYALQSDNFNYQEYKKQTTGVGSFVTVWLWNSFGEDLKNPRAELARPEVIGTEVALLNTTCVNNNNCASYEILHGWNYSSLNSAILNNDKNLKAKIVGEARQLATFLSNNLRADQICRINPALENKFKREAFQRLAEWIAPEFGSRCELVWNPPGGNPKTAQAPATVTEGHGPSPVFPDGARCIANPDGSIIPDADYPYWLAHYGDRCEYACAWGPHMNCRNSDGSASTHPRDRSCRETSDFRKAALAMVRARQVKVPGPWKEADNKSLAACADIQPAADGEKSGFLSKASDEIHYNAWTVLFPALCSKGVCKNYKKVESLKRGEAFYTWSNKGLYTEDGSNRPTWRACVSQVPLAGCKDPYHAPKNVVIRALDDKGKWHCWKVEDPAIRND